MAFGMRLYNTSGTVVFNEDDRLPALIGTYSYTFSSNNAVTTTVTVSGISATTHFAHDPVNNYPCKVGTNQVIVSRQGVNTQPNTGTIEVMRV